MIRPEWLSQALARVQRVLLVLLLMCLLGVAWTQARAACGDVTYTSISTGASGTVAAGLSDCASATAWLATFTEDLSACALSGGHLTFTSSVAGVDNYTYDVPSACVAPGGGGASSVSVGNVQLVLPDFLNLSPEDGLLLSGAIIGVWAAAFAWRAVGQALRANDGDES